MKAYLKKAFGFVVATLVLSPLSAATVATLTSPSSGLTATVDVTSQIPYLLVRNADSKQLTRIRLGLTLQGTNYGTKLSFAGATEPVTITDTYRSFHGKRAVSTCTANAFEVTFTNSQEAPLIVEVRAYEDGIAFRYKLPGEDSRTLTFTDELTTYQVPAKAYRWLQSFNTSYEADFPFQNSASQTGTWGFPALFELDGTFFLITEANIGRNYCSTHLDNSSSASQYKVCYPFDYEGYNVGSSRPSFTGTDWVSPWRLVIAGSLADVVESTLVEDVSDPCVVDNTDFVQPGRAAWVYWAYNHGTKDYRICCQYVDLAVKMGWEYVLFDWEWEQMGNGGSVEDAVRYAREKGIKPLLWYHSNDSKMQNHSERVKELSWLRRIGVVGIKIDFFESDKQHTMQYFADLLEDAAQYRIMVNFHGCTVPRGWSRTYPHLMSQEAVFGGEQYNNGSMMTTEGARINCLLPYTRNVIGPMDYTPVAFTNSQHPHTTTYAHELALSVAFESGIQHWADRPEGFYALPYEAQLHMKNVPAAWDETRFIDGYPGKAFTVARRKGDTWYIACLNGEDSPRQQEIDLSILNDEHGTMNDGLLLTCIADGADEETFAITHHIVTLPNSNSSPLTPHLLALPRGGFTLIIQQVTYAQFQDLKKQATALLTTTRKNIGTEPGQYKETYVQALADALDATSDVANDTTPERLNTAYATLADAFSALQINGKNQVVNTKGSSVQPKGTGTDVTRTYLREVRNFSRSDNTGKRFGKPRSWTVENFQIDTGAEGVKQGIDNYPGYNCLQLGRWEESANRMNDADHENQRLYRRVTLPAGRYYFGAAYHYIDPSRVGSRAYLFVANEPLATAKVEERAIAYGTLNTADDDGNLYGLRFQLDQEQEVVLGWQMDGREQHTEFRCQQVQLMQYPIPDETDGIEEVGKREEEKYSFPEEGLGMGFQGAFDLSGRQVINRKLPKGIYISPTSRSCGALSKGHKIVVK